MTGGIGEELFSERRDSTGSTIKTRVTILEATLY